MEAAKVWKTSVACHRHREVSSSQFPAITGPALLMQLERTTSSQPWDPLTATASGFTQTKMEITAKERAFPMAVGGRGEQVGAKLTVPFSSMLGNM